MNSMTSRPKALKGFRPAALATSAMLLLFGLSMPAPALGQVRLTQQQALRLAFPEPAVIERRTAFLSENQIAEARKRSGDGIAVDQRVVTFYVASHQGRTLGVAYFDAHRVRTLNEVLLIVVKPTGSIERIEVLRFTEPPEYRPPEGWLAQFRNKGLADELSLKGSIVGMSGATLTSRAVTHAARRTLALHEVIRPIPEEVDSKR